MEILSRLERVDFTDDQARTIAEIIEDKQTELATKQQVEATRSALEKRIFALEERIETTKSALEERIFALEERIETTVIKAKYDLVKWIVGAVVVNGLIATMLKVFS